MIEGLSHITFMVTDLERTRRLWCEVLGAEVVFDSREAPQGFDDTVFLTVGGVWVALIATQESVVARDGYDHVALKIADEDYAMYEAKLTASGVAYDTGRMRKAGEGWSLYFRDFDGHLLELHTGTLDKRLRSFQRREMKV